MPGPEREVRVRVAREVELVRRARTPRRRGSPTRTASRPRRRGRARRRRSRPARGPTARTATDGVSNRSSSSMAVGIRARLRAQPRQRVRVAEQRPPAVAGAVDRRLVPRVEQQDAGRDELLLGQRVAVVDDRGERADQVVARPLRGARPAGPQVIPELDARLDRLARRRLGRVELVHQADVRATTAGADDGPPRGCRAARR